MRRLVFALLGIAMLGIGGVLGLRGVASDQPVVVGTGESCAASVDDATRSVPFTLESHIEAARDSETMPTRRAEQAQEPASTPTAAPRALERLKPTDPSHVEGRVVVVDEEGVEHHDGNGSFVSSFFHNGNTSGGGFAFVKDGRFRVLNLAGHELHVDRLEIDGHLALPDPDFVTIEMDQPLVVRARFVRAVLLHVVDARTHAELRDVTVIRIDEFQMDGRQHPGAYADQRRLIDHGASPFEITPSADAMTVHWNATLFAMAPGYAWGAAAVHHMLGGEATIELPRGGDLEVTIEGEFPPPKRTRNPRSFDPLSPVIRLLTPIAGEDSAVDRDPPDAADRDLDADAMIAEVGAHRGGATRIDGLPPGPLRVTLERGDHFPKPQVLAETTAEIVEGGIARVKLTITGPGNPHRVRLAGTVRYSSVAWANASINLRFEPIGVPGSSVVDEFDLQFRDLSPADGAADLYRFDAGEVLPGRWLVTSSRHNLQQIVDTGPDGTEHAQIVIGDPADVVVRLIESDSGQTVGPPIGVRWTCRRPAESDGWNRDVAEWDEKLNGFTLRAPAGEIELSLNFEHGRDFDVLDPGLVSVQPGQNEVTLRVRRATVVALRLRIDDHDAGWLDEWEGRERLWEIHLVDVDDPSNEISPLHGTLTEVDFHVDRPGRYVVRFPQLAGFEPVAPFEIRVRREEKNVGVVELRRVR